MFSFFVAMRVVAFPKYFHVQESLFHSETSNLDTESFTYKQINCDKYQKVILSKWKVEYLTLRFAMKLDMSFQMYKLHCQSFMNRKRLQKQHISFRFDIWH